MSIDQPPTAAPVEVAAPAKINLALHVTGRRDDGYHLLDSLVVFAALGDRVRAAPHQGQPGTLALTLTGPFAQGLPPGEGNLVMRAARLMASRTPGPGCGVALELQKALPLASGIGGGSADAAATIHALARLWNVSLPSPPEVLALGADVPVCLHGKPTRMTGVGERLGGVPPLPLLWLVLVNPGVETPTGTVFEALERPDNQPMPSVLPIWRSAVDLAGWLISCSRNDLQPPAQAVFPVIGQVIAALGGQPGCLLARMSGSGATCFGLFATRNDAQRAAKAISRLKPAWWVSLSGLAEPVPAAQAAVEAIPG